ncbi:hypothetical protein IPJ91_01450 [bacterium]|nr:MAG: hypothetical protein IPJ91_01450 [bacterium]
MSNETIEEVKRIFPKRKNSLSTCENPKVDFESQNRDEQVYILSRAAFVTNLGWIIGSILELMFLAIIVFILTKLKIPYLGVVPIPYIIIIIILGFSLILDNIVTHWIRWFYNLYIVTNERIVDYDFTPGGTFRIAEAGLLNIEDVSQTQSGFLSNLFNYGNLRIQTASEKSFFLMERIANPSYLRDKILDLKDAVQKDHQHYEHKQ